MISHRALWSLALGGLLLAGCKDDKKDQPAPPTTPPAPTVPAPQATGTPSANVPATMPSLPGVADTSNPSTAPAGLDAETSAAFDHLKTDLQAKNWDAAEADLKTLESHKDKLPDSAQAMVSAFRAQLNADKTAASVGNLKIPGLGGKTDAPTTPPPPTPPDANK